MVIVITLIAVFVSFLIIIILLWHRRSTRPRLSVRSFSINLEPPPTYNDLRKMGTISDDSDDNQQDTDEYNQASQEEYNITYEELRKLNTGYD